MRAVRIVGLLLALACVPAMAMLAGGIGFRCARDGLGMLPADADRFSLTVCLTVGALSAVAVCLLAAVFDIQASLRAIAKRTCRETPDRMR